jgi:ubiquinone/menaquinone biosynthesis C-methylase UbiE
LPEQNQDQWAEWLLHRRHGNNHKQEKIMLEALATIRDRVLFNAELKPNENLLDVGCGNGLIALEALKRTAPDGKVIFSDISQDLLNNCREQVEKLGLRARCRFIQASADDLSMIQPELVDVVTTRSVLIYVSAKQQAFQEFFRVLKPGGRLSIFEPINSFGIPEPLHLFRGYDVTPVQELAQKVFAAHFMTQSPAIHTMIDFNEHELLIFAEQAGFQKIHLSFEVDIKPQAPQPWSYFAHAAPNPLAKTFQEVLEETLTPAEANTFINHLRPLVENGQGIQRRAVAFLHATKLS